MALSKPPGSWVGERWIGLIYAPRRAAGKFNDPPCCQHHKALFWEGHKDVMKIHPAKDCGMVNRFENCSQIWYYYVIMLYSSIIADTRYFENTFPQFQTD